MANGKWQMIWAARVYWAVGRSFVVRFLGRRFSSRVELPYVAVYARPRRDTKRCGDPEAYPPCLPHFWTVGGPRAGLFVWRARAGGRLPPQTLGAHARRAAHAGAVRQSESLAGRAPAPAACRGRRAPPVSYTHLRAHETGAYL
eukprot:3379384-Pyramimonas_sp.AAC.1